MSTPDELQPAVYAIGVKDELDKIKALMLETWGYAPDFDLKVEVMLRVAVDFHMKGFAHRGRSIQVHVGNLKRRSAAKVARAIASEVTEHRDTCAECGEGGQASLWQRRWALETDDPERTTANVHRRVLDADGKPVMEERWGRMYPKWETIEAPLEVYPDAVETYLEPGRARKVTRLIQGREARRQKVRELAKTT